MQTREWRVPFASMLVLFYLLTSSLALAEVYKWVDEEGRTHFSDAPPAEDKNTAVESVEVRVNTFKHVSIEDIFPGLLDPGEGTLQPPRVVMYSTEWCGVCKKAKRYFRKNGIPFKEYDIERNRRAERRFKKLGGNGVPLIRIGKKKMSGFSLSSFNSIYAAQMREYEVALVKQQAEQAAKEAEKRRAEEEAAAKQSGLPVAN